MTTIAATKDMIAADRRVDVDGVAYYAGKLYNIDDFLIGAAGDNEAIMRFLDWWPKREDRRLRINRKLEFEAIVLSHAGLWVYDHAGIPDVISDGIVAIGTGRAAAMAAMDTMRLLRRKVDPRSAVLVARQRDNMTGGAVDWMRLKRHG